MPDLLEALRDEDEYVRWAAAKALSSTLQSGPTPPEAQARRAEIRRLRSWAKRVGRILNERPRNALGPPLHRLRSWAQRIANMRNPKVRRALSPLLHHLPRWVEGVEGVEGIENNEARQVLEAILLRLERLEAAESVGLLEAPSLWQRWSGPVLGILAALGLGLVALVGALAAGAGKRLEEALQSFWESQPLGVVVLAIVLLAILGALVTWVVERWKKQDKLATCPTGAPGRLDG